MLKVKQGSTVRLYHYYVDGSHVLTAPTSPKVSVYDPGGSIISDSGDVALENKTPTESATGIYYLEFTLKSDQAVGRRYCSIWTCDEVDLVQESPQPNLFEIVSASSIPYYADIDAAAELSGLEVYKIQPAWLDLVDEIVHSCTGGVKFRGAISVVEYVDVWNKYQKAITLKHFPVVSVSEVLNDIQSSSPETLVIDTDIIWQPHGRVCFKEPGTTLETVGESLTKCFSKGRASVKVTYTYGYASVPEAITELATALLARIAILAKNEETLTSGSGHPGPMVTSFRAGDFAMTFGSGESKYVTKFDSKIKDLLASVERTYRNKVTFG